MEISVNSNVTYGMKPIQSLHRYASKNPDKVRKIDSNKLRKANDSIKRALKGSKIERYKAQESASKIILTI